MNAVVGADVPVESFYLDVTPYVVSTKVYRAEPPPLNAIVENIVPNVLTKTWLTKGLLTKSTPTNVVQSPNSEMPTIPQSSSGGLVQHTTIRLITRCLLKLSAVLESFPPGWAARSAEVVDTIRKRVPEASVIVGVAQEAVKSFSEHGKGLLAEGSLRLLWLYARVLPGTMAEVRFDVGKLLQETEVSGGEDGVRVMCQIHVLRLLGESDQFVWSVKPGELYVRMFPISRLM